MSQQQHQQQQAPNSTAELVSGLTMGSGGVKVVGSSTGDNKTVRDFNMPPPGCDNDAIKLFVGSIPPKYTEDTLRPYFEKIGDVVEISVLEGRGSGFVWYKSRAQADRAMRELDGKKPGIEPKDEHRPLEIRQARVKAEAGLVPPVVSMGGNSTTVPSPFPSLSSLNAGGSSGSGQLPSPFAGMLANLPQLNQQPFNSYAANMPTIFQLLNYNPTLIVQFIDSLLHQNNQHIQFLTQLKQALVNMSGNSSAAPALSAFTNAGRRSVDLPSSNRLPWDQNDFANKRASIDIASLSGQSTNPSPTPSPSQPNAETQALLNLLMNQQGGNLANHLSNLNSPTPNANPPPQPWGSNNLENNLLSSLNIGQDNQNVFGANMQNMQSVQNVRDVLFNQGRQNWGSNQSSWGWGENGTNNSRPSMEVVPENIVATCEGENVELQFGRGGLEDASDSEVFANQFSGQLPRSSIDSMVSGSGTRTSFESSNSSQASMLRYQAQFGGSPATPLFMRPPFQQNCNPKN